MNSSSSKKGRFCTKCSSNSHNIAQCWLPSTSKKKQNVQVRSNRRQLRPKSNVRQKKVAISIPRTIKASNGIISNNNEIIFSRTFYFDWTQDNTDTKAFVLNLIEPEYELTIPRHVRIHALPNAKNAETSDSSFMFTGAVPVYRASLSKGEGTVIVQNDDAGVVNSIVAPTFNVNWTTVAKWDLLKIFRDSNIQPVDFATKESDSSDSIFNRLLFRYRLVNPDDYTGYTNSVQLKIVITYTGIVPVQTNASVALVSNNFSTDAPTNVTLTDKPCQFQYIRVGKDMR